MGGQLLRHSTVIQIVLAQPRCRKCFQAGFQGRSSNGGEKVTLIPCPKCMGVALCEACFNEVGAAEIVNNNNNNNNETAPLFHRDCEDPQSQCEEHLLSLCGTGMIVEQGNPLGLPSSTDCLEYWNPKDWREYFARKRTDYEIPPPIFAMAPIASSLSDAHSHMLTLQHILGLPELVTDITNGNKQQLVIHLCGAAAEEGSRPGRYVEMIRLNPQLEDLQIHLIGPDQDNGGDPEMIQDVLDMESIRHTCEVTIRKHVGLYHEVMEGKNDGKSGIRVPKPTIVFCPQSGLHDPGYTEMWRPTMIYMMEQQQDVPFVLTGYSHEEVVEDCGLLEQWGAKILVPPRNNPFRGLRPFLDPSRENGRDHIYSNASFLVAKGKK